MDSKSLFFLIPDPYTDPDLTFGKLIKNVLLKKILYFLTMKWEVVTLKMKKAEQEKNEEKSKKTEYPQDIVNKVSKVVL